MTRRLEVWALRAALVADELADHAGRVVLTRPTLSAWVAAVAVAHSVAGAA